MSVLLIAVHRTRRFCGRAVVLSSDGRTILGPLRILATASTRVARKHRNLHCSPTLPFGHPPLGAYVVAASLPPAHRRRRVGRYGQLGALVLEPVAGDAAVAGRRIVLHGGPLDPKGRLRPTRGGLRVSDRDLAALFDVLNAANAARDPLALVEISAVADDFAQRSAMDLPGGRGIAGSFRQRREIARRRFLAGSAALLAGMVAGATGCTLDRPSSWQPTATDPGDGGIAKPDAESAGAGGNKGGGARNDGGAGDNSGLGNDGAARDVSGLGKDGGSGDNGGAGDNGGTGTDVGGDDNGGYTGGGGFG